MSYHNAEMLRARIAAAKRSMLSPSQQAEQVIRDWGSQPTASQIEEAQQLLLALRAELNHPKYKIPTRELTPGEAATYRAELQTIGNQIYALQGYLGIR
jgi:hypothetical protein